MEEESSNAETDEKKTGDLKEIRKKGCKKGVQMRKTTQPQFGEIWEKEESSMKLE